MLFAGFSQIRREFGFFNHQKPYLFIFLGFWQRGKVFSVRCYVTALSIFAFLAMRPRGMAPCWPPSNTPPKPLIGQNLTLRPAHVTKTVQRQEK